jgi:hypothetical protein
LSTTTLTLASDKSIGSNWSKAGFSGSATSGLTDGSDSTYMQASSSSTGSVKLNLSAIPGNVTAITAVQIQVRCAQGSSKAGSSLVDVSIGNSAGGDTALSSQVTTTPGNSFATVTLSPTLNDATIADWGTAYLAFGSPNDGLGNTLKVSEVPGVILTVTLNTGASQRLTLMGCG